MLHQDWMRMALEQAQMAFEQGEVPIGAVVVHNGQPIALAHNEREQKNDPTAHAEVLVIQRAAKVLGSWRLTDATLYVTLEPCPMCAGAIMQSRIKQLVYGAMDLKGGATGSVMNVLDYTLWNHRVDVVAGVLEEECADILKSFFRRLR
ncbi:tRNA adenosine(34) deaminase TadA [Desulfosporosinus nitroreducens]|uniref:tRNA-specific adenosine deaminase n=1 Tax=Desulfosporosinus nitroreducens TaxID=2018668 RepID=A0ABT8QRL9_9FIRM|nr:tRNA adenosine(34) deaminase TadA [Desulfosporosinus nitroreducens]MCO1601406.1 tRNA adenosine(34) deaminase TadA [Desulfosporosinus nitroreducens]MDO0823986.1 tRNA adenosine(34) deaminase TadA [Desulfosporosinus nitroreducens]